MKSCIFFQVKLKVTNRNKEEQNQAEQSQAEQKEAEPQWMAQEQRIDRSGFTITS
jgi:hypothetical protein